MSEPKIKKKHPDHKWRWRAKEPPVGNTDFVVINLAVLQSIFMKCVRLIFSCRANKSVPCTRARQKYPHLCQGDRAVIWYAYIDGYDETSRLQFVLGS